MSKIAFMFPGQGSYEAGMGRDVAEAVPEAMAVYEAGSAASGLDLKQICFHDPIENLLDTKLQQPALVATSLAINEAIRAHGIHPDFVVGHSVGEFAALGAAESIGSADAIRLVTERGIAMAEAAEERPGSMAAILGLADEVVEGLCRRISNVWPANYNCPGQIVVSGEDDAVGECCSEAEREGARRAVRLRVSGAFHSPLVERAADKLRPAVEKIHFADPRTAFMSTVTAKLEDARPLSRAARQPADGAGQVHAGGRRADRQGRDRLRRGRPRQRAQRFTEEDRQERAHRLRQRHERPPRAGEDACLSSPRWRARRPSSPAASKGIGKAIATELAAAGATVVVGYRSGKDEAEALAAELGGSAIQADVSSAEDAKRLVEEAGDLDILVNNAGLTRDGLLARMSDDDWRTVIDTNLASVFYTCRAVTRPMMKKRAGAIVNISSIVGVHGNWGQTNYAASKAGIIGFTKSLARELGSRNIRANVVAPGYVKTQLTDVLPEEATGAMLENTPLGRLGDPEDVAGAVRFLCSDAASFITGEVLLVDGGLGM